MRGRKLWALCLAAAVGLASLEWPGIPVFAAEKVVGDIAGGEIAGGETVGREIAVGEIAGGEGKTLAGTGGGTPSGSAGGEQEESGSGKTAEYGGWGRSERAGTATGSEAEREDGRQDEEPDDERDGQWNEQGQGEQWGIHGQGAGGGAQRGTPSEPEKLEELEDEELTVDEIGRFFEEHAKTGRGKLKVYGDTIWYLNYERDFKDKSYAYQVLDSDGEPVDQTWWNYRWNDELNGWQLLVKAAQYSLDGENYRYFILDDDGCLATKIPAVIDGKPVVSMDNCFSVWSLPMREPGEMPKTVVSAVACYGETEIEAMPQLPDGLRYMDRMFEGCTQLTETTTIPASVESVGRAFLGTAIVEPPLFAEGSRIREMKDTFVNCRKLETIGRLPDHIERLDGTFRSAFLEGTDLSNEALPEGVVQMNDTFFDSNISRAPRLPEAVRSIDKCFEDCRRLEEVPLLPDSIESAERAFAYCRRLKFGDDGHVYVVAPKGLKNARNMFMGAYHTAGEADAFQRDSERLYLWDEEQWENMNQTSYGKKPGEESRDSNGDYIISKMPVGLLDIELLSTGPYIDTAVTVQNEKRAAAVTFRSDTWGQWENAEGKPVERIEYRIGGEDDFQSWDGNPLYLYEDAVVEAKTIRTVETYDGPQTVETNIRTRQVSVRQPDMPVFSHTYKGGGIYDVTVLYRPFLRSIDRVELYFRVNGGEWKAIENTGHIQARCEDLIEAYADWGVASDTAFLRLPDYVKRIEIANPEEYTGLNGRIPIVCNVYEADAGDRSYRIEEISDPGDIAEVWKDVDGSWCIGNTGYGDVTVRAGACDGSGVAAEHTFSFGSRVQGITLTLENHRDGVLEIGSTDHAVVSITPPELDGFTLSSSDPSILSVEADTGTVTGRRSGTVVLKAASTRDPAVSGTMDVTVLAEPYAISVLPETLELYSDETAFIYGNWYPERAASPEIAWEGVDVNCSVTDQAAGRADIQVRTKDDRDYGGTQLALRSKSNTAVSGVCSIVWKPFIHEIRLEGPAALPAGNQDKLSVIADVESDEELTFVSSAPDILEVDQNGVLTAKREGSAVVTVTAGHRRASGQLSVQVIAPESRDISEIHLSLDRDVLCEEESCGYRVVTVPEYTSGTYAVTSSDPEVAKVRADGTIEGRSPGTAVIRAEEEADPAGGRAASDEVVVMVVPNDTAILRIFPQDSLWEKNGNPVIYKNLPGGIHVPFGYDILTDAPDRSVKWSVIPEENAVIDGDGVLNPKQNGWVTVMAASSAYPEVTAQYQVEIRTVATDIQYHLVRDDSIWESGLRLVAEKYPEDASTDRIYCRNPVAGEAYEDITECGKEDVSFGMFLELSTSSGEMGIEDAYRTVAVNVMTEADGRYELRSMHDEAPYTVYLSDLDDENVFSMRIFDTQEDRFLSPGEETTINWGYSFPVRLDGQAYGFEVRGMDALMETEAKLLLRADTQTQLNKELGRFCDILFMSSGTSLVVRPYHIRSYKEAPAAVELKCLDRAGNERYTYDLSLFLGGIPEFHSNGQSGEGQYTAVNCEQGEAFLDINGESFQSLTACRQRYDIAVYRDQENVTNRVLRRVDTEGKPCITFIEEGSYRVCVMNTETGAGAERVLTAKQAGAFLDMYLGNGENRSEAAYSQCDIHQFRGSGDLYAYGVPYAPDSVDLSGQGRNLYSSAFKIEEIPGYEVEYELLPDESGAVRADYLDHLITARGYTSDSANYADKETIRVQVKRDGDTVAYIYGSYHVMNQMQELLLPYTLKMEAGRAADISLLQRPGWGADSVEIDKRDIESGMIRLTLDDQDITGPGEYGDFTVTYLSDGKLGLVCKSERAERAFLRVYIDGDCIFERTGDATYRGQRVGEAVCAISVHGEAFAEIRDLVMNTGEEADLKIRCGIGERLETGRVKAYEVLNATDGSAPVRLGTSQISARTAGTWLIQAVVRFSQDEAYEVVCQFQVIVRNPARALNIAERNGRAACYVGEALYLVPGYSPSEADNVLGYEWSVKENKTGIQVNEEGVVTAGAPGDYTVLLRDLPDRSLTAEYALHVYEAPVKAKEVLITPKEGYATNRENVAFTAEVLPAGADAREVIWEVVGANRSGARIGGTGNFQGIRAGDYTVRCSLASNPEVQDTAVVHVSVMPEYLYLKGPSGVAPGTAIQLEAMVFPEDAAYDGIDWEIETGKEYATVSQDGMVTCTDRPGYVTVKATISGTEICAKHELLIGNVLPELEVEIRDGAGQIKTELWDDNDPAYLYIDGNRATRSFVEAKGYEMQVRPNRGGLLVDGGGIVHGLEEGDYAVEVSREAEGMTASGTAFVSVRKTNPYNFLTVRPKDGGYRLFTRGGSKELEYRLTPALRENDRVVWSVESGADAAVVNQDGRVTALGERDGLVTVKCAVIGPDDGKEYISQNCTITVEGQIVPVTGIEIHCADQVTEGEKTPVQVTVMPENANNTGYHVLVSDSDIGVVEYGYFWAARPGVVTLTAVADERADCTNSVTVTVRKKEEAKPEEPETDEPGEPGEHEDGNIGGGDDEKTDGKQDESPDSGNDGTGAGRRPGKDENTSANGTAAVTTFWRLRDGKWYYYDPDGRMVRDGWVLYREQWYRLGADGVMLSNCWFKDDSGTYYLGNNGAMAAGSWGWVDGCWHYFDQEGHVVPYTLEQGGFRLEGEELLYTIAGKEPWIDMGGYIFYLDERRNVLKNQWIDADGKRFYAGGNGWILRNQWNEVDGSWYFMNPDGSVAYDFVVWEGQHYKMDEDGTTRNTEGGDFVRSRSM